MTLAIQHRRAEARRNFGSEGFQPLQHALRELPKLDKMPKDSLGQDIAFLIIGHPELKEEFRAIDLDSMSVESKVVLLERIKGNLGIQPLRSRRLAYVGPVPSHKTNRHRPRPALG